MITRTTRACASYLAALPSTRAIPNREVFYVARCPAAPFVQRRIELRKVSRAGR